MYESEGSLGKLRNYVLRMILVGAIEKVTTEKNFAARPLRELYNSVNLPRHALWYRQLLFYFHNFLL